MAEVHAIFKKGEIHDIKNYRPISVLLTFSKIFEKLMCNRLISFIAKHNILTDVQHGFREGKFMHTARQSFLVV
jgi:hypothetical protein